MKYKVVSLFCGCGGMDLGFSQSGFDTIWANDYNDDAIVTYKHNIGNHAFCSDITSVKSEDIPDCDVVIGGFPCQGFSLANSSRSTSDWRNFLYKEMLRVVRDKQPKFFVAENVKGLLSLGEGQIMNMIIKDFQELGYEVDYEVLRATDYGIPQNRDRVIIIGNNLGLINPFPEITHGEASMVFTPQGMKTLSPLITVKEAIGHLADVPTRDLPFTLKGEKVMNHVARTNVADSFWKRAHPVDKGEVIKYLKSWRTKSKLTVPEIDKHFGYKHTAPHWFREDQWGNLPTADQWWELKNLLGFCDTHDKAMTELVKKKITFDQSLRISNWDQPSDTIMATGTEIHPNKKRRLSVREAAILQSFPNDFEFFGSISSMIRQIGNAVPPTLAYHIAQGIQQCLEKYGNEKKVQTSTSN